MDINKNKLIFILFGFIFLVVMLIIGIDMSKKTTFPGSKGNLKERIEAGDE